MLFCAYCCEYQCNRFPEKTQLYNYYLLRAVRARRRNGSTCVDLVEDCKKATSVHFYVAIKSSQNKDNRIATITCTHHVQLPSLQ